MKKEQLLFVVFLFLWWLDLVLTLAGIHLGVSEEANLIPRFLMEWLGTVDGAIVGKIATSIIAYVCVFALLRNEEYEKAGWLTLWLLILAAALIVANNILILL